MSMLLLAIVVLTALSIGYVAYGSFIARQYRLDDARATPAAAHNDGVDFVPTRPFYLMAQHFSAIAAAGPIVGPIAACAAFGWVPCVIWIVLGVILIGAVHDFSALVASVRHDAQSIAEVARVALGRRAWLALILFIWLALLYVIVAFTSVTVATFTNQDPELAILAGDVTFNKGGAVASASTLYLLLALVMGLVDRLFRPPMWLMTLVFVPATLGMVYLGTQTSTFLVFSTEHWYIIVLAYCFAASLTPVWLLQQSRGYLGGFVLYLAIGIGLIGMLLGGFSIKQPAFSDAFEPGAILGFVRGSGEAPVVTNLVLPFLFVTIACGACSGFHGLVCGGTTSKQISRESHCKPIAFGAMLLEGFVAIIALSTIMMLSPEETRRADGSPIPPGVIYGDGIARFMTIILGEHALVFARTFGAMAVATFVFDTLDVSTRLGRYLLMELLGTRSRILGACAAAATAGIPLAILLLSAKNSYLTFWTLFGTSNQLLAGLTLLGVTIWLRDEGRKYWYTLVPMVFILCITISALLLQILDGARRAISALSDSESAWRTIATTPQVLNALIGVMLLGLAALFLHEGTRAWKRGPLRHGSSM